MSDSARHSSGTVAAPCAVDVCEPGSVELNEVPDGLIIYDVRHGDVHYLNPTAAAVYLLCDGRIGPELIADELQSLWNLAEPPAESVRDCLAELVRRDLVM